jgi:hypothetical protein
MGISAIALQGLQQSQAQLESAATNIASLGASSQNSAPLDLVSVASDMVALTSAQNQFSLSLATFEAGDEIEKNTIDTFA